MEKQVVDNLIGIISCGEELHSHYPWLTNEGLCSYAIVDAAQDEQIWPTLMDLRPPHRCLYRGNEANELAEVSPYLVSLTPKETFAEWLIREGYGNNWCCFLFSPSSIDELQQHLQRFTKFLNSETQQEEFYRFYDPRVWEEALHTFGKERIDEFAGPITAFMVEDPSNSTTLRSYSPNSERDNWSYRKQDISIPFQSNEAPLESKPREQDG